MLNLSTQPPPRSAVGATLSPIFRYITPEELLQQQEQEAAEKGDTTTGPPKQIIVDMRGPQTKLVSSMDDLAPLAPAAGGDGGAPKLGQELLHNVGLMVGLAETELQVRGKEAISLFVSLCTHVEVCVVVCAMGHKGANRVGCHC